MSVELTRLNGVKVGTIPYYSTSGWAPPIGPLSNPVDLYVPMWQSGRLVWSPIGGGNGPLTGLLTTTGDMIYRDGTGAVVRLPIGNLTDILNVQNSGGNSVPGWQAATSTIITDFNEAAQDAVGAMVADTATIDVTYTDSTPELKWDLKAITRDIPLYVTSVSYSAGVPFMTDETVADVVRVWIRIPTTWDAATDITLVTKWLCTNTGLKDLETQIIYFADTDEASLTTVQAFTNTNLTWAAANTTKLLTTTLTSLAAGRSYRIDFRCNTGDANTGNLFLEGAYATTKVQ